MRTIRFLLQKEFIQIFRNKGMLPILFVMPIIQLMVLSFAATYELKEVRFSLMDMDQSEVSREVVADFQSSGYFKMIREDFDMDLALTEMDAGEVSMILRIPDGLQESLYSGKASAIQLIIDALDGSKAGLIQSYSASILQQVDRKYRGRVSISTRPHAIQINTRNWYNPDLDYVTFMVPGILVVLVSMIGLFLSGMNIVREQEVGTIEQLNVTPIQKHQFMIGKLLPFWIIGMVDLLIGLALARYAFHIPFLGSLVTVMTVAGIYLVVIQALGLLISTLTHTQQQAMFIAWFLMVIFILMGGLFTPIESMPRWAQNLTHFNPVAYFIDIMRMVLLKGAGWHEIGRMVGILCAMGFALMTLSINRYSKTSG